MSKLIVRLLPGALTLGSTLAAVVVVYALAAGGSVSGLYEVASAIAAPTKNANCSPDVIPVGQSNPPGSESEPMAPIWCFDLAAPGAPTRVSGANDWVDTFTGVTPMGRFSDGDYDYRLFDSAGSPSRTQHFTNNNHWMVDSTGAFAGGDMMRPNRSFRFENGKLVVEADAAAGISGYGGVTWMEMTISTAGAPTGDVVDNLYAYGQFGGADTFGCRLQADGTPMCSYEAARKGAQPNARPCFEAPPARLVEISWFEQCGPVHTGGLRSGDNANFWRQCSTPAQVPDMQCRDRFRMELSQAGLKFYVNGHFYFEDSSWAARYQLPAEVVNGSVPVYIYFSDWQVRPDQPAYRFHWQRLAINPHNSDGSIAAPSAAPSFCLGQPNNTCAMAGMPMPSNPNPPVLPASTNTPTAIPARPATAVATSTSLAAATATSTAPPAVPNPGFTSSINVSSGQVQAGANLNVVVSVKSATAMPALVDVEVYDATGHKAFQRWYDNQQFGAGETRTYALNWVVPPGVNPGSYVMKVGVFSPGWSGKLYAWNDNASVIAVR